MASVSRSIRRRITAPSSWARITGFCDPSVPARKLGTERRDEQKLALLVRRKREALVSKKLEAEGVEVRTLDAYHLRIAARGTTISPAAEGGV
jgi:hypothetical protein